MIENVLLSPHHRSKIAEHLFCEMIGINSERIRQKVLPDETPILYTSVENTVEIPGNAANSVNNVLLGAYFVEV